ncbi:hypothetical protein L484_022529 [Morus notabilis]|uniref:Uncharacterized protein n=2 Tax=Morus notabilis TaxID=981085 RepID=W9R2I5_9ROSA|nr:hypothetical protein L484_022529 [Morus notabilis]
MEAQEVVLIQDSAIEVCVSFIKWALKGLPLRDGDKFTLVSVLHQVNTPLGRKRVDSCSMLGANPRIIELEAARIQEEYENHAGLVEISQVEFNIEVATGPSCRLVGVEAAKNLNATLVILHRKMKNDMKYFLENLSCGIWRIKDNCKIEQLRAPNARSAQNSKKLSPVIVSGPAHDEISSSASTAGDDHDLFSIEL